MTKQKVSFFWFRRDLRLEDNVGLYQALQSQYPVIPLFIFDETILERLPNNDPRVGFIHESISKINTQLKQVFPHYRIRCRNNVVFSFKMCCYQSFV